MNATCSYVSGNEHNRKSINRTTLNKKRKMRVKLYQLFSAIDKHENRIEIISPRVQLELQMTMAVLVQ